ncbi:MAG: phosphoesterase [Legionellales bacterium]|nr:phosphoesterase [Legionellales bacterium]
MGYTHIEERKLNRFFFRDKFRSTLAFLTMSLILSVVLIVAIVFWRMTQTTPDFYATSGMAAPILLDVLAQPNLGSEPLLPPDRPEETGLKDLNF